MTIFPIRQARAAFAGTIMASCLAMAGPQAFAADSDGFYTVETAAAFEDVVTDLEIAIVNRGLVIDYTGQIGDMLSRTAGDLDTETPYANAVYMQFCSAVHTHESVAADPANIAICPYVVFAYELKAAPGEVTVGYRKPHGAGDAASNEALAGVSGLLMEIVEEAAGE